MDKDQEFREYAEKKNEELKAIDEVTKTPTTNILADRVDPGVHQCIICKQWHPDALMSSTKDPKLCIGCYYDL